MNIQTVTRHLDLSGTTGQGLRERIYQLCEQFGRRCHEVMDMHVVVEGNHCACRQGTDKRCHIKVRGKDRLNLDADVVRADLWQAVDAAFRRLEQLLTRLRRPRRPRSKTPSYPSLISWSPKQSFARFPWDANTAKGGNHG